MELFSVLLHVDNGQIDMLNLIILHTKYKC